MDKGWVKLHREIISNPIFKKINVCHYFLYCILKANHEPKKVIWNKKEMIIEKGSFITGRKKASKETGLSQQNIRTAQQTLINLGMLQKSTTKSTTKFTYLTICNYEKYQGNKKKDNQQLTTNKN